MSFQFDPNQANDLQFEPVPIGDHIVQIVEANEKLSKSSGKPMIELTIECKTEGYNGQKLWDYISQGEGMHTKIANIFKSVGLPLQANNDISGVLIGKVGKVNVKHESYQGVPKARVNYWLPKKDTAEPVQGEPQAPAETSNDHGGISFGEFDAGQDIDPNFIATDPNL